MTLPNGFQILQFMNNKLPVNVNNSHDLERLCQNNITALTDFVQEVVSDNPSGLWQEIKSLPSVSKELFYKHIITSFDQSANLLQEALDTKDASKMVKGLFAAASCVFTGFKNFFVELEEKEPILAELTKKVVKTALIFAVLHFAPYLAPVVMNLDHIVDGVKDLFGVVQQDAQNINDAFAKMTKDPSLANTFDLAETIFGLATKYQAPIETVLSLNLSQDQLLALEATKESVAQVRSCLQSISDVKREVPVTDFTASAFVEKAKSNLLAGIKSLILNPADQTKIEEIFVKHLGKIFDSMQDSINSKQNIFENIAAFSKITKKLRQGSGQFLNDVTSQAFLDPVLRKNVKNHIETFIDNKFLAPIEKLQTLTKISPDLKKSIGLSRSVEYLIQDKALDLKISK